MIRAKLTRINDYVTNDTQITIKLAEYSSKDLSSQFLSKSNNVLLRSAPDNLIARTEDDDRILVSLNLEYGVREITAVFNNEVMADSIMRRISSAMDEYNRSIVAVDKKLINYYTEEISIEGPISVKITIAYSSVILEVLDNDRVMPTSKGVSFFETSHNSTLISGTELSVNKGHVSIPVGSYYERRPVSILHTESPIEAHHIANVINESILEYTLDRYKKSFTNNEDPNSTFVG